VSDEQQDVELERYELFAGPPHAFRIGRRALFRSLGGGLLVVAWRPGAAAQESGARGRGAAPAPEIAAWVHVADDGAVTAFTGKAEVGQDIRTTLAQGVAEELAVPLAKVTMVMGDTAQTPYDMGTFGSRTTPTMLPQLRRAAAAARALLARGEKVAGPIPGDVALTAPAAWKVLGQPAHKTDGRAVVTGQRRYTSDQKRPGMLWGKVLRPPRFGAELARLDDAAAKKVAGARVVRDGGFVGVVAADADVAAAALSALRPEWSGPAEPPPSSRDLFAHLKSHADGSSSPSGDVDRALAAAAHRLQQSYTAAYIAHAPLEPRAAVAEWEGERLTVWTGTQRPFGVRRELADALRVPEAQVRVIVPDTGAGYGGKHTGEAAVEAARLARAAGKPVKVVWTREEELTWAYFRPAGVADVRAGLDPAGALCAWECHNYNSGGSGLETPYQVAARHQAFHSARSPLRQGSYRALASTFNHFAFRLHNLQNGRLRAVLSAAAERFGWGQRPAAADVGHGLACGTEKGGYVATCAEVRIDREAGRVQVLRAVTAFECGAIVNPDVLRNQVEGAVIMGLGGALSEAIEFAEGRVLNARFSGYRVPRFADVPRLETVLLDRKDLPSAGAGESPIVAIAPAIGNAIAAAGGPRLRAMPMRLRG
jgi:isoquinoline 1-oxidoreductase